MILIFGGTTEGRAAVETLDAAGQTYYYSTRSELQQIECLHGLRISGAMEAGEIAAFCRKHGVRLLVDAAHPFAVRLHRNISRAAEELEIPVIRYERKYPRRDAGMIWCDSYDEAIRWLEERKVDNLLALTGVQTISKLKEYWTKHPCWFRVLDRTESRELAIRQGFPAERLIFFDDPQKEEEMMSRLQPDALLTKESGESGYFREKTEAAKRLQIPVVVIKRPPLPEGFYVVAGKHGLRHRVERLLPGFFPLRTGFTTGSCACAAAKAALWTLLTGEKVERVAITLPCGEEVELPVAATVKEENQVMCMVVKDAGDDPDVTDKREICAKVCFSEAKGVKFRAGEGVGTVTLPGLGLEVGEPAINVTPRAMMRTETEKLLTEYRINKGVVIEIAVPGGADLARKTFNPKLGIAGGISIIGTSGVVRPFSSEAFVATIRKEIQVAGALGCRHIVINSGAKSERILKGRFPGLSPQAFIHYGNFIGDTLKIAVEEGIERITMGIMIGKAVKLAEGNTDTHSGVVSMNREFIAALLSKAGGSADCCRRIYDIALARELWTILPEDHPFFGLLVQKCSDVCREFIGDCQLEILLIPEIPEKN